jgi:serine protease DegS
MPLSSVTIQTLIWRFFASICPALTPIELANAEDIAVGDVVLAIGNPYGFGHSVSQGIISGVGRFGLQLSTYEGYIQTDATIHLGSSGGALD